MRDSRIDKLADVLVSYSTRVKKGDLVRIGGKPPALPLMEAMFERCLAAGAHPFLQIATDATEEAFFRLASDEQLSYLNPIQQYMIEKIDVYFGIQGGENTKAQTNVAPTRQALSSLTRKPFLNTLFARAAKKELRWNGTLFPTNASAQDAEMSLFEYADFVYRAGLLHLPDPVAAWRALSEKQQRLVDFLNTKKEIRVVARDTDLRLGIEGRRWINCDGHENFPDGEVFTGPIEDATEGKIRYSFPAVHGGRECHDIVLTFRAGKVVDAHAAKGEDFLLKMIDQDPGARILGEFAIGTNFGITRYTKNTLFDEKIGGTCHAALGAAYPESGGKNQSALHWDMVCDLRDPSSSPHAPAGVAGGCRIEADGQTILHNGRFIPEFAL